jgi:REP element-mobilizing transposase RayT
MPPIRRRTRLPHFEVPEGVYHVTWRLHRCQTPLSPDERTAVQSVIEQDGEVRCDLFAGVIMDDHVHVLFAPLRGATSMKLAAKWKSISAHWICARIGRTAPLWQRDSYQRLVRTAEQISSCRKYIIANPTRRWGEALKYRWVFPIRSV